GSGWTTEPEAALAPRRVHRGAARRADPAVRVRAAAGSLLPPVGPGRPPRSDLLAPHPRRRPDRDAVRPSRPGGRGELLGLLVRRLPGGTPRPGRGVGAVPGSG